MNKIKSLEYSQKIFKLEIFVQALLLMLLLLSPVKLVSLIGSFIYILVYIAVYKLIIKKSDMKKLLILNVLFNIFPALYYYIIICQNYESSLTAIRIPVFTFLVVITVIAAYKVAMSKKQYKAFNGLFLIAFLISQFILDTSEVYTMIMIGYIIMLFFLFRYPFVCFRMYKNKEEYIYY